MINDGYNRAAVLTDGDDELRIEYRPALRWERLALFARIALINDEQRSRLMFEKEIQKRLVATNQPIHSNFNGPLLKAVLGQDPASTEFDDAKNLVEGLRLLVQFPKMEHITCADCQKWWMDPRDGEIAMRGGKKMPRPDFAILLCQTDEGCPKGNPQNEAGLSAKNKRCLNHYLECRATGLFPDDAIVKRNARLIARELKNAKHAVFTV